MADRIRPRLWNRTDPDRPRRCISIMRPGPFGNPFTRVSHPSRQERISEHRRWLREQPALVERIRALDDVDLMCCCSPMPCHGDAILELWDELNRPA
jgi:hypothetical protein